MIVHLSDPHLTGNPASPEDVAFAAVLAKVAETAARSQGVTVVVTGDIRSPGKPDSAYLSFKKIVARYGVDVVTVAGNHDNVEELRSVLADPRATGTGRYDYRVSVPDADIVILDTSRPEYKHGTLDVAQIEWLGSQLDSTDRDTIVAFHHPPISCGSPTADMFSLDDESCRRLHSTLEGRENIVRLLCGHIHATAHSVFAGHPIQVAGSSSHFFDNNPVTGAGTLTRHSRLEYLELAKGRLGSGPAHWTTRTVHLN